MMIKFVLKVISRLLGYVCTAITLIPFFIGVGTFSDFLQKLNLSAGQFTVALFLIFVLISVICLIQYINDSRQAADCGTEFSNFEESLLAAVYDMRKKNAGTPDYSSHAAFYEYAKLKCEKLCGHIVGFLKAKYGKDFSVCIKMIDKKSLEKVKNSGNIGDAEVYTFCRGGRTHSNREMSEKNRAIKCKKAERFCVPVSENSDFHNILRNDEGYETISEFACSNLRMNEIVSVILKQPKYRNSTPEYWKHYRSAVVVPIRVEKCYINLDEDDENLEDVYQTVGFLCVDYQKPISGAMIGEMKGYIKGFGESLYALFHEIGIMDRRITQQNRHKQKA